MAEQSELANANARFSGREGGEKRPARNSGPKTRHERLKTRREGPKRATSGPKRAKGGSKLAIGSAFLRDSLANSAF